MSEAIYIKKDLFGAYRSRRIGVHHSHSSKRGSRQVGQKLRVHNLIHKKEAKILTENAVGV